MKWRPEGRWNPRMEERILDHGTFWPFLPLLLASRQLAGVEKIWFNLNRFATAIPHKGKLNKLVALSLL